MKSDPWLELELEGIGQSYASLRLIHPQADAAMVESLGRYGQLSPVVVARS